MSKVLTEVKRLREERAQQANELATREDIDAPVVKDGLHEFGMRAARIKGASERPP